MKLYDEDGCYCLLIAILTGLDASKARMVYQGSQSQYDKAILGGIPTAISSSSIRNIRSAIGRKIKRK